MSNIMVLTEQENIEKCKGTNQNWESREQFITYFKIFGETDSDALKEIFTNAQNREHLK